MVRDPGAGSNVARQTDRINSALIYQAWCSRLRAVFSSPAAHWPNKAAKMKAAIDRNVAETSDSVSGPSVSIISRTCVMRFCAMPAQSEMPLNGQVGHLFFLNVGHV